MNNTVAIDGGRVVNPEETSVSTTNSCVTNCSMLVSDLALAGAPICGRFRGREPARPRAQCACEVRALLDTPEAWRWSFEAEAAKDMRPLVKAG